MKNFFLFNKIPLLVILIAALFYTSFAYDLERSDFLSLISLYTGLFFISWKLIQIKKTDFRFLAGVAILFRLIFIFALPNLSQDFYRFIWDGRMLVAGWNPFLYLPEELIAAGTAPIAQAEELYSGMGTLSAGNPTNYPPLHQLIFAIAGLIAGKSIAGAVVVMRIFIIAADLGILWFGKKLMDKMDLPAHRIFWFILNPFVIIELTGNLHFEGIMLFFLIWSLYLLQCHKQIAGALCFGLSVLVKLLPLIFLPLLFRFFINRDRGKSEKPSGVKKLLLFYGIVALGVVAGFLPFLSGNFLENFGASIALWFRKFEFNASIYYIIRWIGFRVEGYNIIGYVAPVLPVVIVLLILGLAFLRSNNLQQIITTMLVAVSIYFFLSTTVHPWYVATPLLLSVFTRYRFALVWSFLVMLSYYAYSQPGFQENLWLVAVEYLVVIGLFIYESFKLPILQGSSEDKDFGGI